LKKENDDHERHENTRKKIRLPPSQQAVYGGQVGATADKSGLRRTRRLDKAECIAISFCFIAFFVEKAINQNFMEQCMFASGETAGFDSY
jgi:hypothetical protein